MPDPESIVTASLLTPPGRGAVAVIRVHDSASQEFRQAALAVDSHFVAVNGRPLPQQETGRICYGHWVLEQSSEDVVVCCTDASTIEISCHGGRAAIQRILDSLKSSGVSVEDWQTQQTRITSPFDAELADALSLTTTTRTTAFVMDQSSGTLLTALEALLQCQPEELAAGLAKLLTQSEFGLHLTQPWRVVLAGRPNVGKSTLINALLGYTRAIVFDQPGTTRDVITGHTAFDGWPVQLADTAGIRHTTDELEQAGITRARQSVESADLVCVLLDISQPATTEDFELLAELSSATSDDRPATIVIAHKADLPCQWTQQLPDDALRVSSTTGDGIDELMTRIIQTLVPTVPEAGTPIPVSQRQIQWIEKAQRELKAGDTTQAVADIQSCLSGVLFENTPSVGQDLS